MCGIFGVIANKKSGLPLESTSAIIERLFKLSETRGMESAGIAVKNSNTHKISVFKQDIPASDLIKTSAYRKFFKEACDSIDRHSSFSIIAHSRLVTNGTQENNNNNQPVIKDGSVVIHNGIVTNIDELWKKYAGLHRVFEVDTEIIASLIRHRVKSGSNLIDATKQLFDEMEGAASIAMLQEDFDDFLLATNTGSLYYSFSSNNAVLVFASERFILNKLIQDLGLAKELGMEPAQWLKAGSGLIINMQDFTSVNFSLKASPSYDYKGCKLVQKEEIINYSPEEKGSGTFSIGTNPDKDDDRKRSLFEFNVDEANKLKRCSKCLLPETFPFIEFDSNGVCSICRKYVQKNQGIGKEDFLEILSRFRSKNGEPDCIVPFSGGRDSSYGLHYIVHELKMHPITFTYDWGMVTDLARRNIARVCGKLGIENILVSADIKMKRENIRKNVSAWLKNPQLGMIPLFMAGDKQFFYYSNLIKKETGIKIDIWSTNRLENTDFKVGFCGVKTSNDKERIDHLTFAHKLKLGLYYGKNFLLNPAYLNSSLKDTMWSFYSYYAEPRIDFYQLFDYISWNEKEIEKTLFGEYNWEISPDTTTTWRIGDGTAAFYNYIYYNVAGFSEFDTFRSNQIREGMITREEGLKLVNTENRPRFESFKWYCETAGIDFDHAVKTINAIPKLYRK